MQRRARIFLLLSTTFKARLRATHALVTLAAIIAVSLSCSSSTEPKAIISPSLSTIGAAASSLIADGATQTLITVTLKDTEGAAYERSGGVLTLSSTSGTLGSVSDLNNGTYTATLTSSKIAANAVVSGNVAGIALSSTATVSFVAGPAVAIAVANAASNGQSAVVGSSVANPPSVKVTDASGNSVSGVPVTFSIASGGGSVTGANQTTDASGVATVASWKLGSVIGTNTLVATISTASAVAEGSRASVDKTVTFTATAVAGAPASISVSTGDAQTAIAGTAVATPPSVKLVDAGNNPVSGVTVNFAIASGGGSLTDAAAVTNAAGIAAVGSWKLGNTVGANSITASTPGLASSVTITATGIAGPAANIAIANPASDGQTAAVGNAVVIPPSVKVTDAGGNPVAGVAVTFAVASGSGSITGPNATTNASGIATVGSWTLGATAGTNTLTATSTGLSGSPVTFTATGTAGAAGAMIIVAGDGQTAIAGSAVAVAPSVKVTDVNNNPVAGVTVLFSIGSGDGTVTGATVSTDASGIATVGGWKLGNVAGANTLTATAASVPAATFSATGTAGAAALISINGGNNQSATTGNAVAVAPSVKVTDAFGNAVSGAAVTFAVASGGGSVTGASATTDANGIASIGSWTLGSAVGPNTLTASLNGVAAATVTFNATSSAIPPLIVNVTGSLERSERVTLTVTQNGNTLAPGSYTATFVPSDGGSLNSDGTVTLLKAGALTINVSASGANGTKNITVILPPSIVFDFLRNGNRDIWRVALDGGDLQQLTTDPGDDQHPSSAAGKLVFTSAREGNLHIYVQPLSGGTATRISPVSTTAETEPRISRNGQRVAYISNTSGLGRAVYANIDGTNPLPVDDISGNTGAIEFSPDWNATSDKIVFGSTARSAADIYIANTLGGVATFFSASSSTAADLEPVYSPDGTRIAFISNRNTSNTDLYVANADGSGLVKIATNVSGPAWARSDRLVFETVTVSGGLITGTLHWIDPGNPAVVHDINVGIGDARNASPIY